MCIDWADIDLILKASSRTSDSQHKFTVSSGAGNVRFFKLEKVQDDANGFETKEDMCGPGPNQAAELKGSSPSQRPKCSLCEKTNIYPSAEMIRVKGKLAASGTSEESSSESRVSAASSSPEASASHSSVPIDAVAPTAVPADSESVPWMCEAHAKERARLLQASGLASLKLKTGPPHSFLPSFLEGMSCECNVQKQAGINFTADQKCVLFMSVSEAIFSCKAISDKVRL